MIARSDRTSPDQLAALAVGALAAGRVVIGTVALVAPGPLLRRLPAPTAPGPVAPWLARVAGVRDLCLGLGTLAAHRDPRARSLLVVLGVVCDATDAVVTVSARGLPARLRAGVAFAATAAAVTGAWAVARPATRRVV